nr:T9SS type A sorting domain-containing protein [Maribellus sediminis]
MVIKHTVALQNVDIYDISGKLLIQKNVDGTIVNVPAHELKKGIYILRVQDAEQQIFAKKIVVF